MNGPIKANPQAGGLEGSGNVRAGQGTNEAKATPQVASALRLALVSLDCAIAHLDRHSLAINTPPPGVVEAADSLDAARTGLVEAMTGGARHDAA